jgi:hypothetical protein
MYILTLYPNWLPKSNLFQGFIYFLVLIFGKVIEIAGNYGYDLTLVLSRIFFSVFILDERVFN